VDYDGEHHAGMGNGTHNLFIGGHESLPPSQGPWCLIENILLVEDIWFLPQEMEIVPHLSKNFLLKKIRCYKQNHVH
jgi:hypothetical protein